MIADLHYIDYKERKVVAVPYTRDWAMDDRFFTSKRAAQVRLMEYLQEVVHEAAARYVEIKQEIENNS